MLVQLIFVTIKAKLLQTTKRNKTKKEMLYECSRFFVKFIATLKKIPKNKSSSSVQGPSIQL